MEGQTTPAPPTQAPWAKAQFRLAQYLYRGLGIVELFWALLTLACFVYFPGDGYANFKIAIAIMLLLLACIFVATFLLGRCPVCNVLAPIPNRKTCRKCGTELL